MFIDPTKLKKFIPHIQSDSSTNLGDRGFIADLITHSKFYDNRFWDIGVLMPPILPFSIFICLLLIRTQGTKKNTHTDIKTEQLKLILKHQEISRCINP